MRRQLQSGFTLVEITVVIAILTVSVLCFTQILVSSRRLDPVSEESRLAAEAARIQLEEMRVVPFHDLFEQYSSGGPKAQFAVHGLSPVKGAEFVGSIILPEINGALREDFVNDAWSMPRDLNRDGVVDALDHRSDALILPVTVRLEWASASGRQGKRTLQVHTMFADL